MNRNSNRLSSTSYAKVVIKVLENEYRNLLDDYFDLKFYQFILKKIYRNRIEKYEDLLLEKYCYYEELLEKEFSDCSCSIKKKRR